MISNDVIIRANLGSMTQNSGPPQINIELRYPGVLAKGYLTGKLQRDVYDFLRREKFTGDVMLRASNAGHLQRDMLALKTLVRMSLEDKDGSVVITEELLTR